MSNEDRLPNELAEVQARLRALAPTPSRIDRDALMYRAGFAAARARGSKRRWVLPLMSAAAAAVIAVVATQQLAWQSVPAPADGRPSGHPATAQSTEVVEDQSLHEQTATVNPARAAFRVDFSNAPLLAARQRALQFEFDEPSRGLASDAPMTMRPAASIRQLREEFLPQQDNSATINEAFPWQWLQPWIRKGETT